jgi:hypothetical protein
MALTFARPVHNPLTVFTSMTSHITTLEQLRLTLAASAQHERRSLAGFILGLLPKKPKRNWTGWIRGLHFWRGRKVILPDGGVGPVYGCVRSKVIVRVEEPLSILGFVDRVYDANDLRVFKVPAAVELGKGKRGIRERPSAIKRESSPINGHAPSRPGSRPRGRPRRR